MQTRSIKPSHKSHNALDKNTTKQYFEAEICKERERLSLSAFLGTEDIGVHIVHINRVIITYTLE